MSEGPTRKGSHLETTGQAEGERLVYVLSEPAYGGAVDDGISLREIWNILWRGKWAIIAVTLLFAAGSVMYALGQTRWYRAEVLLAPAEERSAPSLGQFGGLAALAGVSAGGGDSVEALATLRSRAFAREFIEDFGLMRELFPEDWDEDTGQWRHSDPADWPDIRDAVRYFHDNLLSVSEERRSTLVTVGVEWTNPQLAAEWATAIVKRLNTNLRERALLQAESNVAYLQGELAQTNVVTLQQSISRLLESELQKLMLARGNEEFAFRVIDAAEEPNSPSRPRRTMIVILGTMLGGILGVFGVFLARAMRVEQ